MQTALLVLLGAIVILAAMQGLDSRRSFKQTNLMLNHLTAQHIDAVLLRLIGLNGDLISLNEYTHRLAHDMRDHLQELVLTSEVRHAETTQRLNIIETNMAAILCRCKANGDTPVN